MKYIQKAFLSKLWRKLKARFLTGIIVSVPIAVTIGILIWAFLAIDGILQPVIVTLFGHAVPGVGFGVTVLLIYLVGVVANAVGGRALIRYGEALLAKLPVVRQLYAGVKQITEGFSDSLQTGFLQVVLIEFPRKGVRAIGFITNESSDGSNNKLISVFIPTAPNPTSGFLQIVREDDIIRTDIAVDEAMKMVISAGKIAAQEAVDKVAEYWEKRSANP
ncbi:DUF502 domain-containing protein [Thermodesulfovibrionales bacterium]|nr:DUF502 domain-containing protein [Thermodesulfovibrionales bacterium]MCL0066389.1 DUF502 domain-containing protein [Thermodesulfovibrionales bacterium]MCL0074717.1 DUF502 domain-containing protein [Thermodesulfovibrionales bacterium]